MAVLPFCKITVFILIQKLLLSELFSARIALVYSTKQKAETKDTIPLSNPGTMLEMELKIVKVPSSASGSSC